MAEQPTTPVQKWYRKWLDKHSPKDPLGDIEKLKEIIPDFDEEIPIEYFISAFRTRPQYDLSHEIEKRKRAHKDPAYRAKLLKKYNKAREKLMSMSTPNLTEATTDTPVAQVVTPQPCYKLEPPFNQTQYMTPPTPRVKPQIAPRTKFDLDLPQSEDEENDSHESSDISWTVPLLHSTPKSDPIPEVLTNEQRYVPDTLPAIFELEEPLSEDADPLPPH